MNYLPVPPETYSKEHFSKLQDAIKLEDYKAVKNDRDNFIEDGSICIQSPNGSWFRITVDNSGTLSATSVTVDSNYVPKQSSNPYV